MEIVQLPEADEDVEEVELLNEEVAADPIEEVFLPSPLVIASEGY